VASGTPSTVGSVIPHNRDIEAETAIRQLASSYTDAVNRGAPEDAAEVWAPDGVLTFFGREVAGREKLLKAYRNTFSGFRFIFQMTHTGLVVVEGERAKARWWLSEINQRIDDDVHRMFFGLYQDEVVLTGDGWRFARRRLDAIRSIDLAASETADVRPDAEFLSLLY
jgi:hypothetical protein